MNGIGQAACATRGVAALITCLLSASCGDRNATPGSDAALSDAQCDEIASRDVVGQLGRRMKEVPLLASDSAVQAAIRKSYGPLVTRDLLDEWLANPSSAPGRRVSSPWPDRIEIRSVAAAPDGCLVAGSVLYVTSADTTAAGALRSPVEIALRNADGWRISAYEDEETPGSGSAMDGSADVDAPADTSGDAARTPPGDGDAAAAARVIEQYYAAINERDFRRAWLLWSDSGRASGQTLDEFAAGFAQTSQVGVETGPPGRIEGAAGSRFITFPVTIQAVDAAGRTSFAGSYTLRRSVVDGATPEQRSWRIHSADIARR